MRMTTKGRYGLRAVVNLASRESDEPVPLSSIAREEGISTQFLEQIFFALKKAGVVASVRGPKGGFVLARDASDIDLRQILLAVDESLFVVPCTQDADEPVCSRKPDCPTYPVWKELSEILGEYFGRITIRNLVDNAKRSRGDGGLREAGGTTP